MDKYKRPTEPNLMQHYFDRGSAVYRILHEMRLGIEGKQAPRFKEGLISDASREIDSVRAELDKSTYPFMRDLNAYVFGGLKNQRVILVVEGRFFGERTLDSVIGVDLGVEPFELYKGQDVKGTLDDAITVEKARDYLVRERTNLRRENWEAFLITASKFFYFVDDHLDKFQKDGRIDMPKLIPLVTETKGYVGVEQVRVPTPKHYLEHSPGFVSYRLKTSLKKKLLWKLGLKKIERPTSDWAASREVTADEDEVRRLVAFLESSPRLGKCGVQFMYRKNFYDEEGHNGRKHKHKEYKGYKVVVRVSVPGHKPTVREIQVVDRSQYYKNEIDTSDPVHHSKHKRKVERLNVDEDVRDALDDLLEKMFGKSEVLLSI